MSTPRFRRLHPADPERPAAASPETLTKEWIVKLIEHTPLEQIRELPTDRIARDAPPLIEELVEAISAPRPDPEPLPPQVERYAQVILSLREEGRGPTPELPRDIAALEGVLLGEIRRRLAHDPGELVEAVDRLVRVFSSLQAMVLEDLLSNRASELEWLAHTDGLTGLFNLRYLQTQMDELIGLHQRYGHPFALLLLDVDGLKRVNDSFGHAAGDQLLLGVAEAIREAVRSVDVPARIGGDEFCVLAPHQTAARAGVLADRLAAQVETLESSEGARIGVSIGVVSCPEHSHDPERLLELADGAMYRAKSSGERVVIAEAEPAVLDE